MPTLLVRSERMWSRVTRVVLERSLLADHLNGQIPEITQDVKHDPDDSLLPGY